MSDDGYTRITLRIPNALDERLNESAKATSKSKNAEIIARLEQSFLDGDTTEARVEKLEREMAANKVDGSFKGLQAVTLAHNLMDLVAMLESANWPPNHPFREKLALMKQTAQATISRVSLDDALTDSIDSLQGALVELRKLPIKD